MPTNRLALMKVRLLDARADHDTVWLESHTTVTTKAPGQTPPIPDDIATLVQEFANTLERQGIPTTCTVEVDIQAGDKGTAAMYGVLALTLIPFAVLSAMVLQNVVGIVPGSLLSVGFNFIAAREIGQFITNRTATAQFIQETDQ